MSDINLWWGTRYQRLVFELPELPPCPGEGVCHGPLSWCELCGDVSDVCDAIEWPDACDCHERYPEKPEPVKEQLCLPFAV